MFRFIPVRSEDMISEFQRRSASTKQRNRKRKLSEPDNDQGKKFTLIYYIFCYFN
jgi:hypothetical protein